MKNLSILIITLLWIFTGGVMAQKNWTGATSTNWNTASNWSPSGVPTSSDVVNISSAPANQPVLNGSTGYCNTLNLLTGATLSITGNTSNNATLNVSLNALINGTIVIGGSITKYGKLITKNINWLTGSTISPTLNGSMEVSGHWWFSSGSNVTMGLCSVQMTGSDNVEIHSFSSTCSFSNLTLNKTSPATVTIDPASTATLTFTGSLTINAGNSLFSSGLLFTIFKGNINNSGTIRFTQGGQLFTKTSGTQLLQLTSSDTLNDVTMSSGGTVQLVSGSTMILKQDLLITEGVFDAGNSTIALRGNWSNNVGPGAFLKGTSRVIFNGGNYHQYCSSDTFNILEVNKPLGGAFRVSGTVVACSSYDWTAGALDVLNSGTFTAMDLADDGIWGKYYVNPGSTINLYQDAAQRVDLGGDLTFTNGGTINVYGGSMQSHWPLVNNASITMNGGILDFKDQAITVYAGSGLSLTTNITGGTIRTSKGFFCNRSDYNPAGGLLELYGNGDTYIQVVAGSVYNLRIIKPSAYIVTVMDDLPVNGYLLLTKSILSANGVIIQSQGNVTIENLGTLILENGAQLKVGSGKILAVNNGGVLKSIGTAGSPNMITRYNTSASHHEFQVNGTLAAKYTVFEYNYSVNIWSDATIDPAYPLDNCTFRYGVDRFLMIANNQDLMIRNAAFTTLISNNIWKYNDAGSINFRDATGAYAGAAYENDPYNRVSWTTSQPGLWTGVVSTSWHTAGNWDDLNVPTSAVSVTIPSTAANMPLISSATANCNSMNLNGILTIQDKTLNINGNLKVNGSLTMNHYLGKMVVQGSIQWYSGSTANITAGNIEAYGNWTYSAGSNVIPAGGNVNFVGTVSRDLINQSTLSSFYDVYISKTGGAFITATTGSTEPFRFHGFYVDYDSKFVCAAHEDIHLTGNIYSFGTLQVTGNSSLLFNGSDHVILPDTNDYFQNLVFNQSGSVTINQTNCSSLNIYGDLTINSGIFSAGNSTLNVEGNWTNNIGTTGFNEGTSRVRFRFMNGQQCSSEQFYILEVDFSAGVYITEGGQVSCHSFDYSSGAIYVGNNCTFLANDLADNGIFGNYYVYPGGTIELHQDAAQGIDLLGNLTISGGDFKVYGGADISYWGSNGFASLTMSGGVLEFVDHGVEVLDSSPFLFTSTITGGTIRTQNMFIIQSPGFDPTGGTVEIYGTNNNLIAATEGGYFSTLLINKPDLYSFAHFLDTKISNQLIIENGAGELTFGNTMECLGGLTINDNGWMSISSATLRMGSGSTINVNSGGEFILYGYEGATSLLTVKNPPAFYTLMINSGAAFRANHTTFEYIGGQGLYIAPGATIDQSQSFFKCTFRNGASGNQPLLTIENDQHLEIEGAVFPTNTWGGTYNVRKTQNQGSITFIAALGAFAGESFEDDPHNLIYWTPNRTINLSSVYLQGLYDDYGMMNQAQDENGPHFPAGIADHVTIELHDPDYYPWVAYSVSDVPLNTDGTLSVEVPATLQGGYRITVRHRNSIEITTTNPISFPGGNVSYSFNMPYKVYGNNLVYYNGRFVIYGGDVNQDGLVDSTDMIAVDNDASNFAGGYIATDVNGDSLADSTDMILVDNNAGDFVGAILP